MSPRLSPTRTPRSSSRPGTVAWAVGPPACEAGERLLYVPVAAILECSLLARTGRIDLRRGVRAFFDDRFSTAAFQPHDLTAAQVYLADDVRFNEDPFDGPICAVALELGLPLITRDGGIRDWGRVRTLW